MKLRHHRKRVQRDMVFRRTAYERSRPPVVVNLLARMIANQEREYRAALATFPPDSAVHQEAKATDDLIVALKYGLIWGMQPSLELSPAEKAARQIVQDAEMFDRTLDHYVRPGGLEAIPAPHHMGTSRRYYEQRMRDVCTITVTDDAVGRGPTEHEMRMMFKRMPMELIGELIAEDNSLRAAVSLACEKLDDAAGLKNSDRMAKNMTFGDALVMLKAGRKVTRAGSPAFVQMLHSMSGDGPTAFAYIRPGAFNAPEFTPSREDMLAEDWQVVE